MLPTVGQRFPALNFEKEKAADISPILFVTPDDPPTLLIHGDQDRTVPIEHSERMIKALKTTGSRRTSSPSLEQVTDFVMPIR